MNETWAIKRAVAKNGWIVNVFWEVTFSDADNETIGGGVTLIPPSYAVSSDAAEAEIIEAVVLTMGQELDALRNDHAFLLAEKSAMQGSSTVFRGGTPADQLAEAKRTMLADLNYEADKFLWTAMPVYPEFEKLTFPTQEREAVEWEQDPSTNTPFVDSVAQNRGVDRVVLLNRILDKIRIFKQMSAVVAGQRQKYEDLIKSASTADEVEAIDFTFSIE